ncbi:protein arginine kinase [bacterium]|nr:protein arginine kinase [bacterium]MCP5462510.1 protein arginine kinase [bacterium]
MDLNKLLKQKNEWLSGIGPDSDIVISSRVRLARNLQKMPFPHRDTTQDNIEIMHAICAVIKKSRFFNKGTILFLDSCSDLDKQLLLERHLISKELLLTRAGSAVAIDESLGLSIMINEEDHLRLQILKSGFQLKECWEILDAVDTEIGNKLDYAYTPVFGYLTSCPTNVGTGMRASVMLHLPGLVMMDLINKVMHAVIKLGMTVRGFYGEGSEFLGNLFQISNQVTLGKDENEILSNIKKVLDLVVEHERNSRLMMQSKNEEKLRDQIGRAYGILANAHLISSKETLGLLSALRMGIDLKYVKNINKRCINELYIATQPAHLQKQTGKLLEPERRDAIRAELIRNYLHNDAQKNKP